MKKQLILAAVLVTALWCAAVPAVHAAGSYANVNGLKMYYEVHGTGGTPLVLLHGGISGIGTSFGKLLPGLAKGRQVVAVELQGHGRTADVDRPLALDDMAESVSALLKHLKIAKADFFGYSMGGGVALQVAHRHPEQVRKLVTAGTPFFIDGMHPEVAQGMESLKPEHLIGSPFQQEYVRIAPRPEHFPALLEKIKGLVKEDPKGWNREAAQALTQPMLLIFGDGDVVRPEHMVEMLRLLGGGGSGDNQSAQQTGGVRAQLAILPGTTHVTLVDKAEWLLSMIPAFLDAPMPQAEKASRSK